MLIMFIHINNYFGLQITIKVVHILICKKTFKITLIFINFISENTLLSLSKVGHYGIWCGTSTFLECSGRDIIPLQSNLPADHHYFIWVFRAFAGGIAIKKRSHFDEKRSTDHMFQKLCDRAQPESYERPFSIGCFWPQRSKIFLRIFVLARWVMWQALLKMVTWLDWFFFEALCRSKC